MRFYIPCLILTLFFLGCGNVPAQNATSYQNGTDQAGAIETIDCQKYAKLQPLDPPPLIASFDPFACALTLQINMINLKNHISGMKSGCSGASAAVESDYQKMQSILSRCQSIK